MGSGAKNLWGNWKAASTHYRLVIFPVSLRRMWYLGSIFGGQN